MAAIETGVKFVKTKNCTMEAILMDAYHACDDTKTLGIAMPGKEMVEIDTEEFEQWKNTFDIAKQEIVMEKCWIFIFYQLK